MITLKAKNPCVIQIKNFITERNTKKNTIQAHSIMSIYFLFAHYSINIQQKTHLHRAHQRLELVIEIISKVILMKQSIVWMNRRCFD